MENAIPPIKRSLFLLVVISIFFIWFLFPEAYSTNGINSINNQKPQDDFNLTGISDSNLIGIPVRLDSSRKWQHFVVKSGRYYITSSDTAGIFITTDTINIEPPEGQPDIASHGVDGVCIDGNGAVIEGEGILHTPHLYGVWFKNRPPYWVRDTVYADTITDITIRSLNRGIMFTLIADALVSNCTVDSVYKGIDFTDPAGIGLGVRNVIRDNTVSRWFEVGINIRGSYFRIENNKILNGFGNAGGLVINKSVSHHNILINNLVDGGSPVGIHLSEYATYNLLENDTVRNFNGTSKGIRCYLSSHNTVRNCLIENNGYGIVFETAEDSANVVEGTTFLNNTKAISAINASNIVIRNSTIIGGTTHVSLAGLNGSTMILENVVFDSNKVSISGVNSLLTVKYGLDITVVSSNDTPIKDATVTIYDDLVKVYTGKTDSTGHASVLLTSYSQNMSTKKIFAYDVKVHKGVDSTSVSNVTVSEGSSVQLTLMMTNSEDIISYLPEKNNLEQNFPNPFNPITIIKYTLAQESRVTLKIFSILGEEIVTLVDEIQGASDYKVNWNGFTSDGLAAASGMYLYRLEVAPLSVERTAFAQIRKLILLR